MKGIFGNMFDFNGDGDLDLFEQAAEFSFLNELMDEEEKREVFEGAPGDSFADGQRGACRRFGQGAPLRCRR